MGTAMSLRLSSKPTRISLQSSHGISFVDYSGEEKRIELVPDAQARRRDDLRGYKLHTVIDNTGPTKGI